MKVTLHRRSGLHFEAVSESGHTLNIDGSPDHGGQDLGARPMELLLMSLAGCSAMDVVLFLKKMRQPIEDLTITVDGTRRDEIPKIYEKVHVHFEAAGAVDPGRLERAVQLSMEKYCSVAETMRSTAQITWSSGVSGD